MFLPEATQLNQNIKVAELIDNYEKKFKQWWSTIPPISTKLILAELPGHRKEHVGNPGSGLGPPQICGGVKPVKVLLECYWETRKFHQYENRNSYDVLFQYILSKCNNITDVQSEHITTNIGSSIPAQTRCTRYNIMW
jgi:hypothetical protein